MLTLTSYRILHRENPGKLRPSPSSAGALSTTSPFETNAGDERWRRTLNRPSTSTPPRCSPPTSVSRPMNLSPQFHPEHPCITFMCACQPWRNLGRAPCTWFSHNYLSASLPYSSRNHAPHLTIPSPERMHPTLLTLANGHPCIAYCSISRRDDKERRWRSKVLEGAIQTALIGSLLCTNVTKEILAHARLYLLSSFHHWHPRRVLVLDSVGKVRWVSLRE